jgi:hypothetical protein
MRLSTVSSRKRLLPEIHPVDISQHDSQDNKYYRLDKARGYLLDNQEGNDHGYQNKNVISDILHYLKSLLNAVGSGVSNSIGSPVTG